MSKTTTTTFRTLIFQKLMLICFYHSRCFGTVTCCISHNNSNGSPNGIAALHVYEYKSVKWSTIGLRCLFCILVYYLSFQVLNDEDTVFSKLRVVQLTAVVFFTLATAIAHIRGSQPTIIAINNLFKIMARVRQLEPNYEIYQMFHLVLLVVKIICIIFETGCIVEAVSRASSLANAVVKIANLYLIIGVWLNLHIACLLYVFIDALFGAFNHYMSSSFLLKIREAQECSNIAIRSAKEKQFILDLERISQIYYDIHQIGLELHRMLQVPVATTLLFIQHAMTAIIYFMISKYFATGTITWFYIPFVIKLTVDILVLSLAAHKVIKSSHIIRRIGLDTIIMPENKNWHRNMELFLYHINLYDFKLSILGLFDITNALTLTFIAGILTSISIFIPFSMALRK